MNHQSEQAERARNRKGRALGPAGLQAVGFGERRGMQIKGVKVLGFHNVCVGRCLWVSFNL